MDESTNKGLTDYIAKFNAVDYLEEYTLGASRWPEAFNKVLASLHHDVFSALKPGERLLSVGSGPGIRDVLSASAKYQNITLSDPVPQNRHLLQKYMDDVTEDQRWTEHFKRTAELEGDVHQWPEIRERMRARIKHVVWCDILQDKPLGDGQPEELFDCVMATLCLCTACAGGDTETYAKAIKNLVSLAKPGAPVIIADTHEVDHYYLRETKFAAYPATEKQTFQGVEAAGCVVMASKRITIKNPFPCQDNQPVTIYILAARKLLQ